MELVDSMGLVDSIRCVGGLRVDLISWINELCRLRGRSDRSPDRGA